MAQDDQLIQAPELTLRFFFYSFHFQNRYSTPANQSDFKKEKLEKIKKKRKRVGRGHYKSCIELSCILF
jgi:hypothetical protein